MDPLHLAESQHAVPLLPTVHPQPTRRGRARRGPRPTDDALARGLGWFGIGLGMLELAAPRPLARFLGVGPHDGLIRTMGLREIASGVAILGQPRRPTAGIWSRVGGDLLDTGLLAAALGASARRGRVLASLAAVGGVTALDLLAGDRLARRTPARGADARRDGSVRVLESVVVNAKPARAFEAWRRLEILPTFMRHLERVEQREGNRSHWVARAPGGGTVEWDAEIVDETPGKCIAWRSVGEATVRNEGVVRFAEEPAGRGTRIEVDLSYTPPLGGAGTLVAKLLGEEPSQQLKEDLRRFKQILETGEIPTTKGQPSGREARSRASQPRDGGAAPRHAARTERREVAR